MVDQLDSAIFGVEAKSCGKMVDAFFDGRGGNGHLSVIDFFGDDHDEEYEGRHPDKQRKDQGLLLKPQRDFRDMGGRAFCTDDRSVQEQHSRNDCRTDRQQNLSDAALLFACKNAGAKADDHRQEKRCGNDRLKGH